MLLINKKREFVASRGSSQALRFLVGILLVIGCSVFIGCPVKMVLRIAAGDIGALAGLAGLLILCIIGLVNRRRGYGIAPEFQTGLD